MDGLVNGDSNADTNAVARPPVPDEAALRRMRAAAARHRAAEPQRQAIRRRMAEGRRFPDDDDHLVERAARLVEHHEVPGPRLLSASDEAPPSQAERIMGASNDLQSLNFLARGLRAAMSVARIWFSAYGGPMRPQATGFLVAPSLLLTNHHVFPDAAGAENAFAEFGAEVGIDNELPTLTARFTPDPDTLFLTDADLDFTLVALSPGADGRLPGEVFGHIPLIAAGGKLVVGDPVNVVGHPDGRLKEIAIRANRFTQRFDNYLQYETDTEPGNSGSPVFNDQWEAVALHHSGVPAQDDDGRVLDLTGAPWTPDRGQAAIRWIANEGIRISVVLRRLGELVADDDDARRALLAQLGPRSGLGSGPATSLARTTIGMPGQRSVPGGVESLTRVGLRGRAGAFGGRAQLVFVHGRSQQGRDPAQLRRMWTAGLNSGLTMVGLATVDPQDVWFPFYGDRLVGAMESAGAASVPEVPLSAPGRLLYERLLVEAATRTGMPTEPVQAAESAFLADLVGTVREPLGWIAAHTGVDRLVVSAAFRDVAAYLGTDDTRDAVLAKVMETMPSTGPVVLVAHSLGTIVAMDLLTRLAPEVTVAGLVTVGSPLGMDTVYSRLRVGGPHLPPIAGAWFNAWCPTDAVAIGCPLTHDWSGVGAECAVANAHNRSHDIGQYLGHPEVALPIGRLLA